MRSTLLVVAGESSGDVMAAPVVRRLGVRSFGAGGSALAAAGVDVVADIERLAIMGFDRVLGGLPALAPALVRLLREIVQREPRAALLTGYSELNLRLGRWLRRRGTRVLWYGAPQVWAWRSARMPAVRRACDRLAVILPFEEPLWRNAGADAHYVGHPALEQLPPRRDELRRRLGVRDNSELVVLLPGSRKEELDRHLPLVLAVAERLALPRIDSRLVLAPSLPRRVRVRAMARAEAAGVVVISKLPAGAVLGAADAALAASGTVTLECAAARVPPVIFFRPGPLSALVARALVRVPHVGLPNLVLGERAFPEFVGRRLDEQAIADAVLNTLGRRDELRARCDRVRSALEPASRVSPSESVARLLAPWIEP